MNPLAAFAVTLNIGSAALAMMVGLNAITHGGLITAMLEAFVMGINAICVIFILRSAA